MTDDRTSDRSRCASISVSVAMAAATAGWTISNVVFISRRCHRERVSEREEATAMRLFCVVVVMSVVWRCWFSSLNVNGR